MAIKIRKRGDGNEEQPEAPEEQVPKAPPASDPFLQATAQGMSWFEQNRGLVLGGIVALVVAVIGVWAALGYMESQKVAASSELSPALWDYETQVEEAKREAIANDPDLTAPEEEYASEQARWKAIFEKSGSALEAHQQGEIAQSARLTRAAAAVRLGDFDEAVSLYEAYLSGDTDESMLPFVYLGLATAHGAKGNVEDAVANYDKLVEHDESFEGLALYQKAKAFEAAGNTEKAKEIYHEILEAHPQTPYREDIERRLALI